MRRVRITGYGHGKNTRVCLDGVEQEGVIDVKLEMSVHHIPVVTITYLVIGLDIDVEADVEGLKEILAALDDR